MDVNAYLVLEPVYEGLNNFLLRVCMTRECDGWLWGLRGKVWMGVLRSESARSD